MFTFTEYNAFWSAEISVDELLPATIEERPMLRTKQTIEAKPTIRVALTPLPPRRRVALRPLPIKKSVVKTLKAENAQLKAENAQLGACNAYLMELIAQNNATMETLKGEIGIFKDMFLDFVSNPRLQWRAVQN
jgi:hypothetical protein